MFKRIMSGWRDLMKKVRVKIYTGTLQELLRYGFWGVVTTFISFFSYWVLLLSGLDYRIANLISMVLTKGSAYLANKFFVFHSKRETRQALFKEITLFIITRGISGVIEYVGLIILVDICGIGQLFGKGVMLAIVIILNYVFGKVIVYKGRRSKEDRFMTTSLNNNNWPQPEGNFFDKYHSENPIIKWIMKGYFKELDRLLDDVGQVCRILEAGCGEGEVTQYLSLRYGSKCHIDAFDISEKVIEDAQQKYPHIHFSTGNIYQITPKGKFDLVLCCEVLEHLDTPEKALEELKSVSDGYIIVSVPREPVWRCLNVLRGKYLRAFGNTPGHIQHWSSKSFEYFLKKNGMEIKRIVKPLPWTMILCSPTREPGK